MAPPPGYQLVFEDHFNGTALDTTKWFSYTYGANVSVSNSICTIGPASSGIRGCADWTDCTNPKFEFKFGYIEFYAKLADAGNNRGYSSQLWLMQDPAQPGYEIDIVEAGSGPMDTGNNPYGSNKINCTVHCPDQPTSWGFHYDAGIDLSKGYHLYGALWTPDYVRIYLDDVNVGTITKNNVCIPNGYYYIVAGLCRKWDVADPYQCWPSVEVGTGSPTLNIDYIRVYQCPPVACSFIIA